MTREDGGGVCSGKSRGLFFSSRDRKSTKEAFWAKAWRYYKLPACRLAIASQDVIRTRREMLYKGREAERYAMLAWVHVDSASGLISLTFVRRLKLPTSRHLQACGESSSADS